MFDGMIELRYVQREKVLSHRLAGSVVECVPVLQYRRFLPDASGTRGVSGFTAWMDVPVVEEKKG